MKWLIPILLLLCVSCKTRYITQEVPVVVEHTTTQNHTEWRTDTLFHKDSVYVYQQGDTLREVRYIERWRYRDVVVTDTLRDSVPVVTEVVRTEVVAAPLTWWQRTRLHIGEVALLILGAAAILYIYKVTKG